MRTIPQPLRLALCLVLLSLNACSGCERDPDAQPDMAQRTDQGQDMPPDMAAQTLKPLDRRGLPGPSFIGADGTYYWDPAELKEGDEIAPLAVKFNPIIEQTAGIDPDVVTPHDIQCMTCCTPDKPENCPKEAAPPPAFAPDAPRPPTLGEVMPLTPPEPDGLLKQGNGWSFEDGSLQGWAAAPGSTTPPQPVYGNAIPLADIMPPGLTADGAAALDALGGDYWAHSASVGQDGDFWISTAHSRPSWTSAPMPADEAAITALYSAPFVIAAPLIAFTLGGGAHASQRVELQIEAGQDLAQTYDGIGVSEQPEGSDNFFIAADDQGWTTWRASAPRVEGEHMSELVIWRVDAAQGRRARLRIVDEPRLRGDFPDPNTIQHVNVDMIHGRGFDALFPQDRAERILRVPRPQPNWGMAEVHAHPTRNVEFNGHFVHGDVADPLSHVYDCRDSATAQSCHLSPEMVLSLGAALVGTCAAAGLAIDFAVWLLSLGFVPPTGLGFVACTAVTLSALGAAGGLPVFEGRTYHGATRMTSGGLSFGPYIGLMMGRLGVLFGSTLPAEEWAINIPGVVESIDWDRSFRHSGKGLTFLHQQYQIDLLERAWRGGLRLMVSAAANNRLMLMAMDNDDSFDDWRALEAMSRRMKELTDPATGPMRRFAEIAYSPSQARDIMRRGKLAIILASEVPELGKLRGPEDSLERQIEDLYAMGIRSITPIHGINNPIGGTAIFNEIYNLANLYCNATITPAGLRVNPWRDDAFIVDAILPPDLPLVGNLNLGSLPLGDEFSLRKPADEPSLTHGDYFQIASRPPNDWIGGGITYILGTNALPRPLASLYRPTSDDGTPYPAKTHLSWPVRLNSFGWAVGGAPGCSLEDTMLPLPRPVPQALESQLTAARIIGHRNAEGLSAGGERFLRHAMIHGMLIDSDHASQLARVQMFDLAERVGADNSLTPYPLYASHASLREIERDSLVAEEHRHDFGAADEHQRTIPELQRIARDGGVSGMLLAGTTVKPNADLAQTQVRNDCDWSAKSAATKYMAFLQHTGGRGVAFGTDLNGLAIPITSRFGHKACHRDLAQQEGAPPVEDWRRDWSDLPFAGGQGTVYERCRDNMRFGATPPFIRIPNLFCPSMLMIQGQLSEFSGVIYHDYPTPAEEPGRAAVPAWARTIQQQLITARNAGAGQRRDDDAIPAQTAAEYVAIDRGRQTRPLTKLLTDGAFPFDDPRNTGWDFNLDGFAHIGMLPDLIQDWRNVGVSDEALGPMFRGADHVITMWEQTCRVAAAERARRGLPRLAGCD